MYLGQDVSEYRKKLQLVAPMRDVIGDNSQSLELHSIVAANSSKLSQTAGTNWAALGDAAISFDPLSAQGMYNAMATAMQLSDLIRESEVLEKPGSEFANTYNQQIDQIQHYYEKHKAIYYAQETRWPDAPFWQRRRVSAPDQRSQPATPVNDHLHRKAYTTESHA